jgi:spore coat polysaccharide biosynthesis protein SpsF (cytidylyltransferase family)
MKKIGIVIQARMGSSRLPGKMTLPFYNDFTLLDVILDKFKQVSKEIPVIVATTENVKDDVIVNCAKKHNLISFRGDEQNVLARFIAAAENNELDVVVRVCADNPFLSIRFINNIIEAFKQKELEYVSYKNEEGVPTIRTHYGFFAELVKLSTLKKIETLTEEKIYQEHVTNFIYSNPHLFQLNLLDIPFSENDKVRLTIDTREDFDLAQHIYSELMHSKGNVEPETVMAYLEEHPEYLDLMYEQINAQKK